MAKVHMAWPSVLITLALGGAVLTGCVTTPAPVDQIRYFSEAFNALDTLGQPLLDELALAERAQGQRRAVVHAQGGGVATAKCGKDTVPWFPDQQPKGIIRGFCLPDAGYFSTIGDPPDTAVLRGALDVIRRYADVLSGVAEGRHDQAAIDGLHVLVGNVAALAGAVGAIPAALGALDPLLANAAKQADGREARRLILEGGPQVSALIEALSNAAPALFVTLIEAPAEHLTSLEVQKTPSLADADIARVNAYRVTVANYVALLGRLRAAWDLALAAASAPAAHPLAALVEQTAELKADADAARKALAILRRGS